MASQVIDTRGMTATSHNGYVSFSGGSSSSSSPVISTARNYDNNPIGLSRNSAIQNVGDFGNFGSIFSSVGNNAQSSQDVSNLLNTIMQLNKDNKLENTAQARDNAQLQFSMNKALMREQARLNQNSAEQVMRFNARQAELNREFQERLANTSHQREVEDLVKAGLNPVLSANHGAVTPNGATAMGQNAYTNAQGVSQAMVDNISNSALVVSNLVGSFLGAAQDIYREKLSHEHNMSETNLQKLWDESISAARNETNMKTTMMYAGGIAGTGIVSNLDKLFKFVPKIGQKIAGVGASAGSWLSKLGPAALGFSLGNKIAESFPGNGSVGERVDLVKKYGN